MAIQYQENIKIAAPAPLDKRYLSNRTSSGAQVPYSACTEVNSSIISSERYTGLTVNILGKEYWYKDGILDSCLIEKKYDANIPQTDFITGATNLGFFNGYTGIQKLCITPFSTLGTNYLDYQGNYCSLYNSYYRGTDGNIHVGTPTDGIDKRGYVKNESPTKSWIWNEYVGSSNLLGWILVDGNIACQLGTFRIGCMYYTNSSEVFTNTSWSTPASKGKLTITAVNGSLTTGTTLTVGGPIYNYSEDNHMHFRTLLSSTPNFIKVSFDESFVYVSGATSVINAQNVGGGAGVYSQKSGTTLQLRTIVGSGDTSVTQVGNQIRIFSTSSSGSGYAVTGATNIGSGVGLYSSNVNRNFLFRTLVGSGNTTVKQSGDDVIIYSSGGTGIGTITGGTNGLSVSGRNIKLGGSLTGDTTIDGVGLHDLSFNNIHEFQLTTTGGSTIFGADKNGFLLSYSGGSATFDDLGGIKYGSDYSSNYTQRSLVDVGYVSGQTTAIISSINTYTGTTAPNTYLKLNQSTAQNVCCGQPVFNEGIRFGSSPSASQISGHTVGRIYYDIAYETLSADIGQETSLQIGQETLRQVYNATGSVIPDGSVVYVNGIHTGGPSPDMVTVGLAIATGNTKSKVVGIATQSIGINSYGFITVRGNINGLNTLTSSQYSGMTVGDTLYLSDKVFGAVTNVAPESPSVEINLGQLITKSSSNGKIYVNIFPSYNLNSLTDVYVPSPAVDNVLKWNGVEWTNGTVGSISAGAAVNYYYSTPVIKSQTQPVGLSQDGTAGNGIQVMSLSRTPVVSGGTQSICASANGDTRAAVAWLYDHPLGRTTIDSGAWEFTAWYCVDGAGGTTTVTNNIYQVVPISAGTITVTGATANARRAKITSNQFTGAYFTGTTVNTNASWLQTTSGIYQICAKVNNNEVCIVVPTGYVNDTAVSGNTWNKLFGATSADINDTVFTCNVTTLTEPQFTINCTDKLGRIGFVSTTALHTLSINFNGNTQASYFTSPLAVLHNDLSGVQGKVGDEAYHITKSQAIVVANTSGVNTGDETKSTIESKLTGTISSHTHYYSGLTGIPSLVATSTFAAYTGTTAPVINNAITGVTSIGNGYSVYSATTGHNLILNKIVGSGSTVINKVGGSIVVYSTGGTGSNYVFPSDITVSIAAGKTFGKYCNGDVIPASGKTANQVILMALSEALEPTLSLSSSGNNLAFGASGKTVNLNFSHTINTLGATVQSACVQYCRVGGSWTTLSTSTVTPNTYTHNINDSSNRFCTASFKYRYIVSDTCGASGMTEHTPTYGTYVSPTFSPTYTGSLQSYETNAIRETGNVTSTVAGSIASNNSLINITGYTVYRCNNGGSYTPIITCTGLNSASPITIASYVDSGAAGSSTSIGYCVRIGDQYTSSNGGQCTINFRYASYYGYSTNTSLSSAQVVALGNAALCTSKARTMTLTAPANNYTYVAYPESFGYLTSAIMDGAAPVLGAFSCCCSNSVTNYYGQTSNYIEYKSNATQAFTNNSVAFS